MPEIIKLDPDRVEDDKLNRLAEATGRGDVLAYPTDTFYGLGCDPFNASAIRRLFAIKGREWNKPILLIISDVSQIEQLTLNRNEVCERFSQHFWPGPLTLVVQASGRLPSMLTGETETIGIRLPDHALCRRIVSAAGGVLTGTSANRAGRPSAATAKEVVDQLGDRVDMIVDGGRAPGGDPSTVLDISREPPRIIRQGALPRSVLEEFIHSR